MSFFFKFIEDRAKCKADVPLLHEMANFDCVNFTNSFSNFSTYFPVVISSSFLKNFELTICPVSQ